MKYQHITLEQEDGIAQVTMCRSQRRNSLAEEHLLDQSGRGILLIRSFMDEFEARQLEPNGTEFKMVKYLSQTE